MLGVRSPRLLIIQRAILLTAAAATTALTRPPCPPRRVSRMARHLVRRPLLPLGLIGSVVHEMVMNSLPPTPGSVSEGSSGGGRAREAVLPGPYFSTCTRHTAPSPAGNESCLMPLRRVRCQGAPPGFIAMKPNYRRKEVDEARN